MKTIHSKCANIGGRWFFHPIYHRYDSNGVYAASKVGWYEITNEQVLYCEWITSSPRVVVLDIIDSSVEDILDAIKSHYVKTYFGIDLPQGRKEVVYEVLETGVNYDGKVLNLITDKERSLNIIFKTPRVVNDPTTTVADPFLTELQKLSQIDFKCLMKRSNGGSHDSWIKVWEPLEEEIRDVWLRPPSMSNSTGHDCAVHAIRSMAEEIIKLRRGLSPASRRRALDEAVRNGRKIQWRTSSGEWIDMKNPKRDQERGWKYPLETYRIR